MNIAFFGTSDRSIPILERLKENFNLSLCVTKIDTIVGRSRNIRETAVKKWARENNVAIVEIPHLKDPSLGEVIDQLKSLKVEYGVVADFSMIIPFQLIEYFEKHLINIHFSILPKYRGAAPVQFSMINGDKVTGITYQLIHEKLDKGDILKTIEYNLPDNKTSGEIYFDMFKIAAENLPQVLRDYSSGKITPTTQDDNLSTYTYSKSHPKRTTIFKEDAKIDWTEPTNKIERRIRAYNPWPIAWTKIGDIESTDKVDFTAKEYLDRNLIIKIFSANIEGQKLVPETLQVQGKNKTDWNSFLNGYGIK